MESRYCIIVSELSVRLTSTESNAKRKMHICMVIVIDNWNFLCFWLVLLRPDEVQFFYLTFRYIANICVGYSLSLYQYWVWLLCISVFFILKDLGQCLCNALYYKAVNLTLIWLRHSWPCREHCIGKKCRVGTYSRHSCACECSGDIRSVYSTAFFTRARCWPFHVFAVSAPSRECYTANARFSEHKNTNDISYTDFMSDSTVAVA